MAPTVGPTTALAAICFGALGSWQLWSHNQKFRQAEPNEMPDVLPDALPRAPANASFGAPPEAAPKALAVEAMEDNHEELRQSMPEALPDVLPEALPMAAGNTSLGVPPEATPMALAVEATEDKHEELRQTLPEAVPAVLPEALPKAAASVSLGVLPKVTPTAPVVEAMEDKHEEVIAIAAASAPTPAGASSWSFWPWGPGMVVAVLVDAVLFAALGCWLRRRRGAAGQSGRQCIASGDAAPTLASEPMDQGTSRVEEPPSVMQNGIEVEGASQGGGSPSVGPFVRGGHEGVDKSTSEDVKQVASPVRKGSPLVGSPAKEATTRTAFEIEKDEYQKWEKEVIDTFYQKELRATDIIPQDGAPTVVVKQKVLVVILEGDEAMPQRVATSAASSLPPKRDLQLFHLGKKAPDGVSYGFKEADKTFKHPAVDIGGLTNYQQKLGEEPAFILDKSVRVPPGCDSAAVAKELFSAWCETSGKNFSPDVQADLQKVVGTINDAFADKGGAVLRFVSTPPEHRTLVTSRDVRKETGKYYVRLFGKEKYAVESDGRDLFMGVSEKYVTPNLNMGNLNFEYHQVRADDGSELRKDAEDAIETAS